MLKSYVSMKASFLSILFICIFANIIAISNKSNINVIRLLIKSGASVSAIDKNGYTPLMHALSNFTSTEVQELLIKSSSESEINANSILTFIFT